MRWAGKKWLQAVAPIMVVLSLGGLDHWSNDGVTAAGALTGMALFALLTGAIVWGFKARLAPMQRAIQTALVSVAEAAVGVVLVFLLAAPLTVLLPTTWVLQLLRDERAADLVVTLLLGVGMLVAARAMQRASQQAAARTQAERDAAMTRAELAERERELVRAELQLLRAQVEPHFLWNTLANVEYLIRKNPPQAQQMLAQLIVYLKANLGSVSKQQSSLGSEFESVRAYLGLMQFRMGERLHFELSLPEDMGQLDFPPLVLQTLVENAIKHGLEPKPGAATLRICAQRVVPALGGAGAKACLQVEVIDNGVGLAPKPRTRGTQLGLRNVRERLQRLYGSAASLTVAGIESGGVCARLELPLQAES